MKRRRSVMVDLDGVLYDYHSILKYLASLEGEEYKRLDWGKKETIDLMSLKMEDEKWGLPRGIFRHGHVLKGAIDGINLLDVYYDIIICTHRPVSARFDTLEWIAFHRIPCKQVVFLWGGEPKTVVDADVIIDDRPENVLDFLVSGRYGILWKKPWNEGWQLPNKDLSILFYTTDSWVDAKDWISTRLFDEE